jgi:hypothetical protein
MNECMSKLGRKEGREGGAGEGRKGWGRITLSLLTILGKITKWQVYVSHPKSSSMHPKKILAYDIVQCRTVVLFTKSVPIAILLLGVRRHISTLGSPSYHDMLCLC